MNRVSNKLFRDSRSSLKEPFKTRQSVSADSRGRESYGQDARRSASLERKSSAVYGRWSGPRRSSCMGGDPKRVIKDTRPLTDKNYQKHKIQQLVELLEKEGLSYTVAKLMPPSRKDFENIFQSLYSFFDPSYQVKKLEEEAPKKLKLLGYPFTVGNSAFKYVARTNWPSLLGVLIYLMNLIEFSCKIEPVFQNQLETNHSVEVHSILFRYLMNVYRSGVDNEEKDDEVFRQLIESEIKTENDLVENENKEKHQLLKTCESDLDERKSMLSRLEKVEGDTEKLREFLEKFEIHYDKKKSEFEINQKNLQEKQCTLKELQTEIAKKQEIFDAQGFDGKKHLLFIESQKKELAEKLEKKVSVLNKMKGKKDDREIQIRQTHDMVACDSETVKEQYTSCIMKLKDTMNFLSSLDLPEAKKLYTYFFNDFPAEILTGDTSSPHMIKEFEAVLEKIYEKLGVVTKSLRSVSASQTLKTNEMELKISDLSAHLKLLSVHETKRKETLQSKEKEADGEISDLQNRCESLLMTLEELRSNRLKKDTVYKEMLDELKALKNYRIEKEKDVEKYMKMQRKLLDYCEESLTGICVLTEKCELEIINKVKELHQKSKENLREGSE